jgi:hypothetical protein
MSQRSALLWSLLSSAFINSLCAQTRTVPALESTNIIPAQNDVPTNASAPRSRSKTPRGPSGSAATNAPYRIPAGRLLEFPVPLTRAALVSVANSKNPVVEFARAAIMVPTGFNPDLPTPILLVNGTSDGNGSSLRAMMSFTNVALRLGCIVLAADGPSGKPPNDNPPWRWAMISSLLDHVHQTWPKSRRWPIVSAGYSGGGKWAGVMGAILAQKGYNLIGVFMGAVNQDFATEAAKVYEPATQFRKVPIYISSGTDDTIATPKQHEEVKESLLNNGFITVRLESFKGGHALSDDELRKGLKWFFEEYNKDDSK